MTSRNFGRTASTRELRPAPRRGRRRGWCWSGTAGPRRPPRPSRSRSATTASRRSPAAARERRALPDARPSQVGERTFGKALVQHAFPLPDGGALRLTVAELLSPRQRHLSPATLGDLRDPGASRGGLAPDVPSSACARGPGAPAGDACALVALEAVAAR